jgi:hypothetical protein
MPLERRKVEHNSIRVLFTYPGPGYNLLLAVPHL